MGSLYNNSAVLRWKMYSMHSHCPAGVAELADALDLGSSGNPVQVQVLSPALNHDNPNPVPIGDGFGFLIYF